jgi:hypothetical protein
MDFKNPPSGDLGGCYCIIKDEKRYADEMCDANEDDHSFSSLGKSLGYCLNEKSSQ